MLQLNFIKRYLFLKVCALPVRHHYTNLEEVNPFPILFIKSGRKNPWMISQAPETVKPVSYASWPVQDFQQPKRNQSRNLRGYAKFATIHLLEANLTDVLHATKRLT